MHPRTPLILSCACIVVLWQLPYGLQILYPLTLLATYAHEMGHGLTALLSGANFEQLRLHPDGSGMAVWSGNPGRVATMLIAAGGLVGPSLAGVCILLLSRSVCKARWVMATLAVLMAASVVLWSRNIFGFVFLLGSAVTLAIAAKMLSDAMAAFMLHLLATALCLSWFKDLDYMFSAQAVVNGVSYPSDSAVIAQVLWLPYWFWGAVVAAFSLVVVALGLRWVSRARY